MNHWSPPQSPLRIEYTGDFWKQFQRDPARIETFGLLYGRAENNTVRLANKESGEQHPIGIYFLRSRGEVFLTESNINLFESYGASVALVISGAKAGFFVRDFNGSLQSVRSYQEVQVPRLGRKRGKAGLAAGIVFIAAAPLAALAYFQGSVNTGLSVREQGNVLNISWKSGRSGELKISEGAIQTVIAVLPDQSGVNYIRSGEGDVNVVLTVKPSAPSWASLKVRALF
ncbi:MAG: hypothetical protein JO307_34220 [Bryobacterales bacterium]|nr:hypothetical protein [Bryobacterales bacterium]MBV9401665.1 hypothetical protein [Bryobacterales bacterium]